MLDKSSVYNVSAKGICFWTKVAHQISICWTFHSLSEVVQISHVIFKTRNHFLYKLCISYTFFYKLYIKNGRKIGVYEKLLNMTNNITTEISNSKKIYFDNLAEKLSDPKLNRNAYWGILKSFTNGEKIPIIPPLLINDQLVTNFNEKANNFNEYFSNQCSVIDNSSKLPMD